MRNWRIARDTLESGQVISTVKLPLKSEPLPYETMVFAAEDDFCNVDDVEQYLTEAEAIAGHATMIARWEAQP